MTAKTRPFKCAVVQMNTGDDLDANLARSEALVTAAAEEQARLVVLPETFAFIGASSEEYLQVAEQPGGGRTQDFVAQLARRLGVWIVAGTIPLATQRADRVAAACILFDDNGEQRAVYHKIHLFDVDLPDDSGHYCESEIFAAGDKTVVVETPFARLGLAVCYDLRFPELFQRLISAGAEVITLPSAFTVPTGKAHWEILLRARAVENQAWFLGAGQSGTHANGNRTYGHSMIVDPWGGVERQTGGGNEAVLSATIDLAKQAQIRSSFRLRHRLL